MAMRSVGCTGYQPVLHGRAAAQVTNLCYVGVIGAQVTNLCYVGVIGAQVTNLCYVMLK